MKKSKGSISTMVEKLRENKKIIMLVLVGCLFIGAVYLNVRLNQDRINIGNVSQLSEDTMSENVDDFETAGGTDEDYFESFRNERDELLEREMAYLDEIIAASTSDDETLKDAKAHKMTLVKNMEKEFAIEQTVKAKGFNEAAVTFNGDSVSVVVDKVELSDDEVAKILDIVKNETDLEAKAIKIIPCS